MDVLEASVGHRAGLRRCHVWRWSPSGQQAEWERQTLVVGSLSPLGLVAAGASAAVSAIGNHRRRQAALRDAGPRWMYVSSGICCVVGARLVVREESGAERSFDLVSAAGVESPAQGWLRVSYAGSSAPWAIQVM